MKARNVKFINLCNHGLVDYSLVVIMWLSPVRFHLQEIRSFLYVFSFVYLLLPLLTNYPLGLIPEFSFSFHRKLESFLGASFIIMPFVGNFYDVIKDTVFCIVLGCIFVLLGLFTHHEKTDQPANPTR